MASPHKQQGLSLLEVMVSVVIMAAGILSVIGMQLRTLSNSQDSVRRTQAIRLIDDLSDRLRLLPDGYTQSTHYLLDWASTPSGTLKTTCVGSAAGCNVSDFAQADAHRWLDAVVNTLPMGQANVFATDDPRQLGVMLAWRKNEADDEAAALLAPPSTGDAEVSCPDERICHLQYISLTQRCVPVDANASFCQ